jgi:HAE1 family hydrophobic/amphiphilic exporter-1
VVTVAALLLGSRLPGGFLPTEDQGYAYVALQLPDGSSLQRSLEAESAVVKGMLSVPGVQGVNSVAGFNLLTFTQSTYNSFFFVVLKDWRDRKSKEEQFAAIQQNISQQLGRIKQGFAFSFPPPAILGLGNSGAVTFVLEDRSGANDTKLLTQNLNKFLGALSKRPEIAVAIPTYYPAVPQLYVDVDREKAMQQQVKLSDVYLTMQTMMGGYLVNYFNRFGRQWQTYVQADGDHRAEIQNIGQLYVTSANGNQVPLSALVTTRRTTGPEFTIRFNEYEAAQVNVAGAPGYSSGQVMKVLEDTFHQTMPPEMGFDYQGMSYQEKRAQEGISPYAIFGLSTLIVFLILAAQYGSWTLPLSVLLGTPVAILGAYLALQARALENDVYAQIGLVMLIGLSAKNAVLIVEFARGELQGGKSIYEAALAAAKLRFRPIIMTAFAFILGCIPLWVASGAGGVSRRILGTVAIGGMLAATIIGVFLIPVTFSAVERMSHLFARRPAVNEGPAADDGREA